MAGEEREREGSFGGGIRLNVAASKGTVGSAREDSESMRPSRPPEASSPG